MDHDDEEYAAGVRLLLLRDLRQILLRLEAESPGLAPTPQAQRGRALLCDDLRRAIDRLSGGSDVPGSEP